MVRCPLGPVRQDWGAALILRTETHPDRGCLLTGPDRREAIVSWDVARGSKVVKLYANFRGPCVVHA